MTVVVARLASLPEDPAAPCRLDLPGWDGTSAGSVQLPARLLPKDPPPEVGAEYRITIEPAAFEEDSR